MTGASDTRSGPHCTTFEPTQMVALGWRRRSSCRWSGSCPGCSACACRSSGPRRTHRTSPRYRSGTRACRAARCRCTRCARGARAPHRAGAAVLGRAREHGGFAAPVVARHRVVSVAGMIRRGVARGAAVARGEVADAEDRAACGQGGKPVRCKPKQRPSRDALSCPSSRVP